MKIGDRIKRQRMAQHLTQRDLAKEATVSAGMIGQIESHKKMPGRETVDKIAKALGVAVDYLLRGGDPGAGEMIVTDPDEKRLVLQYRRFSPSQRKHMRDFFSVGADIAREMQD